MLDKYIARNDAVCEVTPPLQQRKSNFVKTARSADCARDDQFRFEAARFFFVIAAHRSERFGDPRRLRARDVVEAALRQLAQPVDHGNRFSMIVQNRVTENGHGQPQACRHAR